MLKAFRTHLLLIPFFATLFATQANAGFVTYTFDSDGEFSGSGGTLSGNVTATFDDGGTAGSVTLTIDLSDLDGTNFPDEKITGFYFNFDESVVKTPDNELTIVQSATDTAPTATINTIIYNRTASNGYKADGDGRFNVLIEFPQSNAFNDPEVAVFTITDEEELIDVSDFQNQLSVGGEAGKTGFEAALRAQGLGDDGGNSGFFAPTGDEQDPFNVIPAPPSVVLMAIGVLTCGGGFSMRRLFRRK